MKTKTSRFSSAFIRKAIVCTLSAALIGGFSGCDALGTAEQTPADTETLQSVTAAPLELTPAETAAAPAETTAAPAEPTPLETPQDASPTPAVTAASAVTTADLKAILNEIAGLQNGTAGISLKQARAAAKLLDWAQDTALTKSEIAGAISGYMNGLSDPEAVGAFCINFNIVSDLPQKIVDGDGNTLGTVSSAGYTLTHASYTQSKWDALLSAYKDSLPGMYTSYADMVAFDAETGWAMFDYWDMLTGDDAAAWLVDHEGYSEADAQTYVDNMADGEFIEKNTNPRLRVVDMSDVAITMMYDADGTPVPDATPVSLTFGEFMNLYAANPDGVLNSYFYRVTVSNGEATKVDQPYWS